MAARKSLVSKKEKEKLVLRDTGIEGEERSLVSHALFPAARRAKWAAERRTVLVAMESAGGQYNTSHFRDPQGKSLSNIKWNLSILPVPDAWNSIHHWLVQLNASDWSQTIMGYNTKGFRLHPSATVGGGGDVNRLLLKRKGPWRAVHLKTK